MPTFFRLFFTLSITVFIILNSGCTPSIIKPGEPTAQQINLFEKNKLLLAPINQWKITGKLGIKTSEESHGVLLNWAQQDQTYRLQLTSPLGKAIANIESNDQFATLRLNEKEFYQANDLEELLQERLGWTFPAEHLFYWVRGLPAPHSKSDFTLNDQHLLATLTQDEWEMTYSQYKLVGHIALPSKIILKNPDLTLTLLIKQWQLPNQAAVQ